MPRILFALLLAAAFAPCWAQGRLYSDGFETPIVRPQFPLVGGTFQLPSGPATDQLAWLLSELATGQNTTPAEVTQHFEPGFDANQIAGFINSLRTSYPDAKVTDAIGITPVSLVVLIDAPTAPGAPSGFLRLEARYTGAMRINFLFVSNFNNTVQFPADQNLTLTQAADKFITLSAAPGLFVGRIRPGGTCESIIERSPDTLRATASIFKTWVLGGVARAVASNNLSATTSIPMVASELAPGGVINIEPINTPFPAGDLATLMMGISDNTATDLLHQQVGRPVINQIVSDFGVAQPTVLTPLLGISEQFHVFRSFDLSTAQSYVNGTEAFQQNFLDTQIVPLGPCCDGSAFFHIPLLTSGTWRATAKDVCRAFAGLRRVAQGSDAFDLVDRAMGAQAAQPNVRGRWDRVWYKGGSLAASTDNFHVLTHAWLLEDTGRDPFVVVAMSNDPNGGIDQFNVQSITGRILELVDQMP